LPAENRRLESFVELTGGSRFGNFAIVPFAALEDCMFEGLFQPMHLLVIFFIALLVFGPKKLPELGKGIGDGIRALKDGMKEPPAEPTKPQNTEVKS
jgi:sec-independent protein translocase protein TatA